MTTRAGGMRYDALMRRALVALSVLVAACATSRPSFDTDGDVPDAQAPDAAIEAAPDGPPPPGCTDGVKSGAETDVDCGGNACPACADDMACTKASDCMNGSCFAGRCGPRVWYAESTGKDVAVAGNQTWVDAQGASLTTKLWAQSLVYLRWTGTVRFAGGGNGLCHLGQRFVVDGTPTGDATWGNAIMVQRGSTRWHEPFDVELAMPLAAGAHTIGVQMTNANGYATCNLDGDGGADYDRSRLVAAAFDPSSSWYAESSGTTGALAAVSAWTDIPGVALTIPLAAAAHVQGTLQGTELAQGSGSGHCAYRLVVDGTGLGDPNHGQAIAVGDVTGGWWAPVVLDYGGDMAAGTHTVRAQVRNSSPAGGTCEAGAGNAPYARFHLLVTASPQGGLTQSLESTGGPQILGSASAWTAVSGLSTSFNLGGQTSYVLVDVAGTERTMSGSGHCAYRLVVDGSPLGNVDHGMAIDVGDGATTWWTYAGLTWATKLSTGLHSLGLEVRNSSNTGDCGVNGDGAGYGRARLLLRAF